MARGGKTRFKSSQSRRAKLNGRKGGRKSPGSGKRRKR